MDSNGYPHWSFHSVGQVGTRLLRWNGVTEDFQEDCYNVPDVVRNYFQSTQGQIAWVARRGQDTSDHLAFVEHELKSLWVQVRLEQKYLRHLIKEHLLYLQSSTPSACCQCPILGDFRQSPIPALFRDLHSEVSFGHGSPPPLKSISPDYVSFVSFWEELNSTVEAKVPFVKLQGGLLHGLEAEDEEASEEAWEDIGEGSIEGSIIQGEGSA